MNNPLRLLAAGLALSVSLPLAGCGSSSPAPAPAPAQPTHLIYSLNDDLYSVPLTGGPPQVLAAETAVEVFLALAGDRMIFSVSSGLNDDIYSVKLDGTGRVALASGPTAEYLLGVVDGRAIIQRSRDAAALPPVAQEILSVPVAGGTALSLLKAPDSSGVAYGAVIDGKIFLSSSTDVATVRADGTERHLLLGQPGSVSDWAGARAALLTNAADVLTVGLDGTGLQDSGHTADPVTFSAFGYAAPTGAAFVGDHAIVSEWIKDSPTFGNNTDSLWSIPPSGAGALMLGSVLNGFIYAPLDAAGGKFIAASQAGPHFSVLVFDPLLAGAVDLDRGGGGTYYAGQGSGRVLLIRATGSGSSVVYDLYAANLDGTGVVDLGNNVATSLNYYSALGSDPVGKPAAIMGDRVLFRSLASGSSELWSVRPDGTGPLKLTQGSGDKYAAAVKGTTVVYLRVTLGQGDLYAVEIDGTNHRVLADTVSDEEFSVLAGDTVVFSRTSGADTNLYAVPLAGGAEVPLTSGAGTRYSAAVY